MSFKFMMVAFIYYLVVLINSVSCSVSIVYNIVSSNLFLFVWIPFI